MYPREFWHRNQYNYSFWLKLVGLILDILGTIIVASAVIKINRRTFSGDSIAELTADLSEEFNGESRITETGLGFIVIGFVLFLVSEVLSATNVGFIRPTHDLRRRH
jgi:hypothetical protein